MKQEKRLCIVYWNMGLGGIQKRIRDIVIDISKNYPEWEVSMLLRRRSIAGFDDQLENLDRVTVQYYDINTPLRMPFGFVFWVGKYYVSIHPDTVVTFQCLLSFMMVFFRRIFFWYHPKLIINEGAVTSQMLKINNNGYFQPMIRLTYPDADSIIVPTNVCKNDLIHTYKIPEDKIKVIPNWTLFPACKPLSFVYDVVYIGRFDPEKNPLFIVNLTKLLVTKHPKICVAMFGNGILQNELLKQIDHEKLNNHILVNQFSSDVGSILRRAKVLVVPSFNEGMPNVVLEAAMCQIPSVNNNYLGVDEAVVQGKTGYIYTSLQEAADYINILLKNPQKRHIMGKNAQQYAVTNFSYSNQRKFIKILTG